MGLDGCSFHGSIASNKGLCYADPTMAHKKAAGTTKNGRDSNPKYLGVKINHGQRIMPGQIILRQRGTTCLPGKNVAAGKDYTLFALKEGVVSFRTARKTGFDGSKTIKPVVDVLVK